MIKKIISAIIILIGALLLSGLVYVMVFNGGDFNKLLELFVREQKTDSRASQGGEQAAKEEIDQKNNEIKKIVIENSPQLPVPPETEEKQSARHVSKDELMRMAASFAERFGSYSNQSNFSNIIDLRVFMSSRMQKWTESYISQQRAKNQGDNGIYYGITTKAISREIVKYDDHIGQATVTVNTRRREATSFTNNTEKVFSQAITVNFVLEKDAWKVDSATWEN